MSFEKVSPIYQPQHEFPAIFSSQVFFSLQSAYSKYISIEIHDRWAKVMGPLMEFREDGLVDFGELREIFRCETRAGEKG